MTSSRKYVPVRNGIFMGQPFSFVSRPKTSSSGDLYVFNVSLSSFFLLLLYLLHDVLFSFEVLLCGKIKISNLARALLVHGEKLLENKHDQLDTIFDQRKSLLSLRFVISCDDPTHPLLTHCVSSVPEAENHKKKIIALRFCCLS